MSKRKYYKSKREATKAAEERRKMGDWNIDVFRMPKGSRKVGWFAVCSYIEWLNTY